MARNESKIHIFGGTGYIGSYMVKASMKVGYPTFVYSRPNSSKIDLLNEFHSLCVTTVKGELNEHEKLVSVLKEVEVVISGLGYPQVLDQLEIVEAIKRAGDINRFLLSDFGAEEDRISVLPPFQQIPDNKEKIRRAIEAAGIPYTFVSANCNGAFFVNHLLHPHDLKKDITVYGGGKAKVVLVCEEDIGSYTIRVANDPRTCNSLVIFRPTTSITSQLELIALREGKMSRKFKKVDVSEEEILNLSKIGLPDPENISISILHSLSVKGLTANFDLENKDLEASKLYPDLKFTTVGELLDIF